jgi:maltose O-acetyltransferase
MSSEKEKMLAGELYDASDPQLSTDRLRARTLCQQLTTMPPDAVERRHMVMAALFGRQVSAFITPPFFCSYGYNIALGEDVHFNVNCVVLDVAPVKIGSHTLFGPAVQIYTASHPLLAADRRSGREFGKPVQIGDDVLIGGGSIICPGVAIGPGTVIGDGSVVTRSIPAGAFAAGNPCRVIRAL